MIKFQKLLPALALVLGATLAMAMNFASPEANGTLKAFINNQWQPIPENTQYVCDEEESSCVARFDELDQMIPGTEVEGVYTPL
ncbi:DUF6520 family protein [Algoriphagus boritolerans]|uniref:Uncharacterized protein n=1 Tax=Algoriphagus boritolerans DSM 17298 = JCM 18970 TaxID=1120964 RepID=A0A1H5XVY0_9BACT|nr:DUF6520 family protein [Algoriphagus boritolerans]SEG15685.1 hypothetical protein SAMN03080598_02702 [Algoriphagus boritolerans DSM 17298 = JCM 18970]